MKHPAKYNKKIIPYIDEVLSQYNCIKVLDPFAGTGYIFDELPQYDWRGIEIEPEWVQMHPKIQIGNALQLPFEDNTFDAVVTSPTFANRMADNHTPKEDSKRITYRHYLGRPLNKDNSGQLQWGEKYKDFHIRAWKEVKRVLKYKGMFLLNIKDHIRNGEQIRVSEWHFNTVLDTGFRAILLRAVEVESMKMGANYNLRVPYENLYVFQKQ